jgi:DNA processing protein
MDQQQREAWLRVTLVSGLSPRATVRALHALGDIQSLAEASPATLGEAAELPKSRAARLAADLQSLRGSDRVREESRLVDAMHVTLLPIDSPDYPALLKHISDPPPLLFMRGCITRDDALSLAIVGARRCSAYGREQADRFAALCATSGLTIVSGGAHGIDAAAHRAVIRVAGRTIAVLGSGLARPYPADHAELFDDIVALDSDGNNCGAVVSELPMTAPPRKENFPSRNRIISGLSLGTLVVEASARSGASITARLAAEDHGREVMALPGRVDSPASVGCHRMLREGWASLVTSPAEVLDALGEAGRVLKEGMMAAEPGRESEPSLFDAAMSVEQKALINALDAARTLDDLVGVTGLSVARAQAELTILQVRGFIAKQGSSFVRRTQRN